MINARFSVGVVAEGSPTTLAMLSGFHESQGRLLLDVFPVDTNGSVNANLTS